MTQSLPRVRSPRPASARLVRAAAVCLLACATVGGAQVSFAAQGAAEKGDAPASTPALEQNVAPQPADELQSLPGFKVEVMLKADPKVNGSWISLQKDDKGRLLLGGQHYQPITRVTVKDGRVVKQEVLKLPVTEVMGQCFADGHLYVNGQGKNNEGKNVFGLFRCKSTRDDDTFDEVQFLREWGHGSGEHGAHAIVQGPDKKLYVVAGNFTDLPADLLPSSPHRNYADDQVLPRAEDGNGFGAGKKPPGGIIVRMDLDGKNPELFASGQRNTYDIAFNADGELFGFDSDMEWDWGTPWYRPIRVFHAVSGGDTGFREGTAKWPEYYADSLPAISTIGIGCPTGVVFGYGAKFPAQYQKAYYILDWTYGRLIAVHLTPKGASYTGTWENFVAPKSLHGNGTKTPLNLTDVVVGDDGAMYFTIGGRNTGAKLFRVTYTGNASTAPVDAHEKDGAEARDLRHKIEAFHGHQDSKAVESVWPSLGSADRFLRYAARIAIESQPVNEWKAKALAERDPEAALTSLLALARLGGTEAQADVFNALAKFPIATLTDEQQLEKLRVYEVAIARNGKPAEQQAKAVVAELDPIYPAKTSAKSEFLNRELCQLLLVLDAPGAVAKTMKQLSAAPTQEEQLTYVLRLRTIKDGWTPELRKQYFEWFAKFNPKDEKHPAFVTKWFDDAGRDYADGSSFPRFVGEFYTDATQTLSGDEKTQLASVLGAYTPPGAKQPNNKKPAAPRKLVKEWQVSDLEPALAEVGHGRNFAKGQQVYAEAQCAACHRFNNEGGAVGPELTAIAARFQRRDILESILLPSKVISEQYQATIVKTKNSAEPVEGRIVAEDDEKLVIVPNALKPDEKVTVKKSDVKSRSPSKVSPMPEGLVNTFTKDEILDLIAYLESAGHKDHPDFKK